MSTYQNRLISEEDFIRGRITLAHTHAGVNPQMNASNNTGLGLAAFLAAEKAKETAAQNNRNKLLLLLLP